MADQAWKVGEKRGVCMSHDRVRLGKEKTAAWITNSLADSLECGDLARMIAAADIVASAHRDGLEAARDMWTRQDLRLVEWLTDTCSRELSRKLKLATGKGRDEWLWILG